MTYLVLENHLSYSIVLDEKGRFIKAANMGYQVGQRLEKIYPIEQEQRKPRTAKIFALAGCIASCLMIFFTVYFNNLMLPYASIQLAINPAVRMEVNQKGTVVGLDSENEDGALLIADYSWRRKPMTQVANELVDRAIDMGYLLEGGVVAVNINSPDETWYQETGIAFRQELTKHVEERIAVTIEIRPGEREDSAPETAPASREETTESVTETVSDDSSEDGTEVSATVLSEENTPAASNAPAATTAVPPTATAPVRSETFSDDDDDDDNSSDDDDDSSNDDDDDNSDDDDDNGSDDDNNSSDDDNSNDDDNNGNDDIDDNDGGDSDDN